MSAFEPGRRVVLTDIPPQLLRGLPEEDQAAIRSIVGRPVLLAGYSFGGAEIEFVDDEGDGHTIWVEESFLKAAQP